jgi:hypothetical protein
MPELKVAYALEGKHDYQVMPVLVKRLVAEISSDLTLADSAFRTRKRGFGFVSDLRHTVERAADQGIQILVCVVDANGHESDRRRQMQDQAALLGASGVQIAWGVAVHELEAWLLADEGAIAAALRGRQIPRQSDPERERDPKGYLDTLISRVTDGNEFYTDAIGAAIAGASDLQITRNRCPSFAQFATRIRNAVQEVLRQQTGAP